MNRVKNMEKLIQIILAIIALGVVWQKYSFETAIVFALFLFSLATIIMNGMKVFYLLSKIINIKVKSLEFVYLIFSSVLVVVFCITIFNLKVIVYLFTISIVVLLALVLVHIFKANKNGR